MIARPVRGPGFFWLRIFLQGFSTAPILATIEGNGPLCPDCFVNFQFAECRAGISCRKGVPNKRGGYVMSQLVVIIQCDQSLQRCPGFWCTHDFYLKTGCFEGYPADTRYMTMSCGGCCGHSVNAASCRTISITARALSATRSQPSSNGRVTPSAPAPTFRRGRSRNGMTGYTAPGTCRAAAWRPRTPCLEWRF